MKKKYVGIFLALVLSVSGTLSGCGGISPASPKYQKQVGNSASSQAASSSSSAESSSTTSSEETSSTEETTSSDAGAAESAQSEGAAETTAASAADADPEYAYQINEDGTIAMNYGAILQVFCWDFKTITENLQDIKDAGYTSIQTSPINECKVGEDGGMHLYSENEGKWYYHYQPTDYVIGNYQLGTEDEFKTMCEEANKIGLKVIVDVVLNHCSSDREAISDNIKNLCEQPFHDLGEGGADSRKQLTQKDLTGLTDLNTQDKNIQEYQLAYLKQCIADGASGFRFDAAKHIELPDEKGDFKSDFWPTILDNGATFQYGEVLPGMNDRLADYASMIGGVTAASYGEVVRSACKGVLNVSEVESYRAPNIDQSKLVTWVESHDNYINDETSYILTEQDVEYGWAIITARSGGAPLFFSRPNNATKDDPWGDNQIGVKGSDGFKSPNVVALNNFRNAMAGQGEKLSNPADNKKAFMIERGSKGAVIINENDEELDLAGCESVLADGTYKDKVTGAEFSVSGGKIEGKVPAKSIIVIY